MMHIMLEVHPKVKKKFPSAYSLLVISIPLGLLKGVTKTFVHISDFTLSTEGPWKTKAVFKI